MREGLRSGKLNVKDGVNSGKGSEENSLGSDSSGEKVANLVSGGPEIEIELSGLQTEKTSDELENAGFEKEGGGGGGADGDEGGSGKVGVAESARKRKRVDGGEEVGNGDVGEEKLQVVEVEEFNDKPLRVLRSNVVVNGGSNKVGSEEDVLDQKSSEDHVGYEKKLTEEKTGQCDELVNKPTRKLKRKRGRPPLAKKVESDASGLEELKVGPNKVEKVEIGSLALDGGSIKRLKGKRGRPRKVQEGGGTLTHKRGIPEKVQASSGALKLKRGRPPKVQVRNGSSRPKLERACKVEKQVHNPKESNVILNKKLKTKIGRPKKVQESSEVLKRDDDKEGEASAEDKELYPVESDGGLKKTLKCKNGRPPRMEESNEVLMGVSEKEGEAIVEEKEHNLVDSDGGLKKKLKCNHGRPTKTQESDEVLMGDVDKEGEVSKRNKRGYESRSRIKQNVPAYLQGSNGVLKGGVDREGEGIAEDRRGLELRNRTKKYLPAYFSYQERVLIGKQSNMTRFSSKKKRKNGADLETKQNDGSPGKTQPVYAVSLENQKGIRIVKDGDVEPGKSGAKRSVRERIVEILLDAGWTIQRRPRAGKEYFDAVYVNPAGRTHWSVTLAYKMLKKHYENGDGESKIYKTGFKFIPIPEGEFGKLKRVQLKKRVGKKKKRMEGDCGNANDKGAISKKKHKKKLVGKLQRGKSKGKSLLPKHKNSAGTQHKGMPVLVRDPKQQNRRNGKRPTLLVRNSMEEADSDADGYIPYAGKRTVLAWMIDLGTVSLNEKVQYMNQRKTRVLREGRLTRDGIHCDCCSATITTSEFEIHAGSKLCEPFKNICLETGTSLLQCLLDSWNKQPESEREGFHYVDVHGEDPNDDACGICGDGGDLICCDGCPSTFHQSCLDIQKFPSGDWHCVYCSCKFCLMAGRNECQEDNIDELAASELLACQLCEEKYHRFCSKAKDSESVYSDSSFCGKKCHELFKKLKILLGVKHDLVEGFSWTLIRRADINSSISLCDMPEKCDVEREIECNAKLAVALSIMDECFLPIVDKRSGTNLIHKIVYNCGSNFTRLNYSGFFTAILERGDEILCAASIRIHGEQIAEMPFIGTRYMYRRQGLCRRLLSAIESVLCFLDVERLVIPAVSELKETWTSTFGFRPLEDSNKQKMKNMNMMVFPHIQMLQKPTLKLQTASENMIVVEGPKSIELEEHQTKEEVLCKIGLNEVDINEPVVESSLQLPDGSLKNTDGKCLVEFGNFEYENKVNDGPSGSMRGLCELIEETTENQQANSGSTPLVLVQKAVELSSQLNPCCISENDTKSLILLCSEFEAYGSNASVLCPSTEGSEGVGCEVKVENYIVTDNLNSYDEGSVHCSTETNTAEPCEKVCVCEFEVPVRSAVCHNSETASQISVGDMDLKCHKKTLETQEMQNNDSAVVQASAALGENRATSTECPVSQNTHTSKLSDEGALQISTQKAEDDSKARRMPLPSGCSYNSFQGNALETHEVSASPDTNCDPSSGAYVDSNGLCKSKKVISTSLRVVNTVQD